MRPGPADLAAGLVAGAGILLVRLALPTISLESDLVYALASVPAVALVRALVRHLRTR